MKRKKFLDFVTTLLLSFVLTEASAATPESEFVCVTQHDGSQLVFSVDSHPVASPMGEVVCFKTNQQQIEVQFLDIKDVKITTSIPSSVNAAIALEERAQVSHGDVLISGATAGSTVSVYDAAGVLVAGGKVSEDGSLHLPLSAQKSGVYIVKTTGSTYKIRK